jgi:hypothetical protein
LFVCSFVRLFFHFIVCLYVPSFFRPFELRLKQKYFQFYRLKQRSRKLAKQVLSNQTKTNRDRKERKTFEGRKKTEQKTPNFQSFNFSELHLFFAAR